MHISPRRKKLAATIGIILMVVAIILVSINPVISGLVKKRTNRAITSGDMAQYHLSVGKVKTNIFRGNIRFSDVRLKPDSAFLQMAKKGTAPNSIVVDLNVAGINLLGLDLFDAIARKHIDLEKIAVHNPTITLLKSKKKQTHQDKTNEAGIGFNLDSIRIKRITGINLDQFEINGSNFTFIDLLTSDTLISNTNHKTELKGLELEKWPGQKHLLKLNAENFAIEVENDEMLLPGGNYHLSLQQLSFKASDNKLIVSKLKLKPTNDDVYKLAQKSPYSKEIFDIEVDSILVANQDFTKSIKSGEFRIDSIWVSGLDLSVLMDKRLPLNNVKRPDLPNHLLKNMKFPIYIGKLEIEKSNLIYQEKMPEITEPMTVTLNNLLVKINRLTSIKDSLEIQKPMTVELRSNFMDDLAFHIDFVFPLYLAPDTFFYSGSLGPAHFPIFNKASFPALQVKFVEGNLKSIKFNGSANNVTSSGEFTMLYNNLQVEVIRKDQENKNNLFSLAANTVLHDANPGSNGKTFEVAMNTERPPHKGFGNFMWKTFESGITGTLLHRNQNKGKKLDGKDG